MLTLIRQQRRHDMKFSKFTDEEIGTILHGLRSFYFTDSKARKTQDRLIASAEAALAERGLKLKENAA